MFDINIIILKNKNKKIDLSGNNGIGLWGWIKFNFLASFASFD